MSRLFEFHVPNAPPEMVAAERLEAIAADVERTAGALERIADAVEQDDELVTDGGHDQGIVGDCDYCDGRMVEVATVTHGKDGTVMLVCQSCGSEGRIDYRVREENPWQNPSREIGVTDTTVASIDWQPCETCSGEGRVRCDGCLEEISCAKCKGAGRVARVAVTDGGEDDEWECPQCGELHADISAKVPGGCLHCVDLIRYIEYEAPGMGMVHNDVSEVVCFDDECENRVTIDPHTMVVEDDDALSIESKEYDPETGQTTGYTAVEIYCSIECRNNTYSISGAPATKVVEREDDLRTDGGQRTYRKLKGVGSWMDVDRPEWATEYGVGSDIALETPDGEFTATVVGFSLKDEYEGLPVVYPPDEIADTFEGDVLVIREEDVVERELRTDGGREEQCAVAGCPRYPIEGDRCRWHTGESEAVTPLLRSVSQALGLICPDLQNFAGDGSERGFPNRSWRQCYDCRAPTTLRTLRRGEVIYHPDEESMEYEWIDVDLCPRCWMQRYGIPCGSCDRLHPDQEAALRCCSEQRGVLPDGGTNQQDEWDPEPASLREGETRDTGSHASRIAEQRELIERHRCGHCEELHDTVQAALGCCDEAIRTDGGLRQRQRERRRRRQRATTSPTSKPRRLTLVAAIDVFADDECEALSKAFNRFGKREPQATCQIHRDAFEVERIGVGRRRVSIVFRVPYVGAVTGEITRWQVALGDQWTVTVWSGESWWRRLLGWTPVAPLIDRLRGVLGGASP